MAVQLTYDKYMVKSLPGIVAWDFGTADITSVTAQGIIPFGAAVVSTGATSTRTRNGVVGSTNILGFAVRSLMSVNAINTFTDAFGPQESVAVLREGYIWLTNSGTGALADDSQLYINATGLVVNSAAAGAVLVPGCRIERGGAVGEIVLARVQVAIPA